jgi:adenylate kinase
VIRNRLVVYADKTEPLIEHYRQRGLLTSVEAHGSIDAITDRLEGALA